ncbi:LptF/LptG family permease [bacterium]|nr:LptF/LptG family permease [bacterium]
MRLLDRYILGQLVVPFLIGLFAFVIIMVGDVARQMGSAFMGGEVPPWLVLKYLLCHVPHAVSWSMPVGTVVGVAMVVALLANHGEITAIRAGGASFPRICRSLILAGVIASGVSLYCGECLAPPASRKAREALAEIGLAQPIVQQERNVFFRDPTQRRIFYVGNMNPKTNELERLTIWGHDEQNRICSITTAEWAEVRGNVWYLREGATVTLGPTGDQEGSVAYFGEQEIKLQAALQDYYASRRTSFEMSAGELSDMIGTLGPAGKDTQRLRVQYHFKYSIPLGCLVFALIAAPISFRFARFGSFGGIVIAVLIVFLYNGVRSWTLAFGLAGTLDPALAGWIPDVLFGALGVGLLARTK